MNIFVRKCVPPQLVRKVNASSNKTFLSYIIGSSDRKLSNVGGPPLENHCFYVMPTMKPHFMPIAF